MKHIEKMIKDGKLKTLNKALESVNSNTSVMLDKRGNIVLEYSKNNNKIYNNHELSIYLNAKINDYPDFKIMEYDFDTKIKISQDLYNKIGDKLGSSENYKSSDSMFNVSDLNVINFDDKLILHGTYGVTKFEYLDDIVKQIESVTNYSRLENNKFVLENIPTIFESAEIKLDSILFRSKDESFDVGKGISEFEIKFADNSTNIRSNGNKEILEAISNKFGGNISEELNVKILGGTTDKYRLSTDSVSLVDDSFVTYIEELYSVINNYKG